MLAKLRKYFISGMVVFLPLALTIYIFFWALNLLDGILGKYLEPLLMQKYGVYYHGLGLIILIYVVVLIGFFVTNFIGRSIYGFMETWMIKLPFFRQVYPALKEMALFLFSRDRTNQFKQVVMIEYPRKGVYSFGFLTNDDESSRVCQVIGKDVCNIFIPSAPGPLTGFVVMVPRKEVIFTEITVEEAFKFILSGGVVNPP